MHKIIRFVTLLMATIFSSSVFAQTTQATPAPTPTDFMHSNGKRYVVVLVVIVILSGLFIYLISLDRKISQLEKD